MAAADSLPDSPQSSGGAARLKSSPQGRQRLSIKPAHFSPEARVQFSARLKRLIEGVAGAEGTTAGPISKSHSPGCSGGKPSPRGGVTILKGTLQEKQGSDTDAGNDVSSHHVLLDKKPSVGATGDCKTATPCDCIERQNSGGLSLSNMALLRFTLAPASAVNPLTVTLPAVTPLTVTPPGITAAPASDSAFTAASSGASPFTSSSSSCSIPLPSAAQPKSAWDSALGAAAPDATATDAAVLSSPTAHVAAPDFMQDNSDPIGDFIPTPGMEECAAAAEGAGRMEEEASLPSPPTRSPLIPSSLPSPASPSRLALHRTPLLRIPDLSLLTARATSTQGAAVSAPAAPFISAPAPAPSPTSASAPAPRCDNNEVLMVPEDDGFMWRKYGQKFIRGCGRPRLYFRCGQPGCPARKTEERAADGKVLERTYLGLHTHEAPAAVSGELNRQVGEMCRRLDMLGEEQKEEMQGEGQQQLMMVVEEKQAQQGKDEEKRQQQQQQQKPLEWQQHLESGVYGTSSKLQGLFDLSLFDSFQSDYNECDGSSNSSGSNSCSLSGGELSGEGISQGGVSGAGVSHGGLAWAVTDKAWGGVATGDCNEGQLSSPSCSLAMIESLLMSDNEASNNEYRWREGGTTEVKSMSNDEVTAGNMTITNGALAVGMDALLKLPQPRPHPTHCSPVNCSSHGCRPACPVGSSGLVLPADFKRKGSPCGEGGGEEEALDVCACCKHGERNSVKQQRTASGTTSPSQAAAARAWAAAPSPPGVAPGAPSGVYSGAASGSPSAVRMVCAHQVMEEPKLVVAVRSDVDVVDDGYHWRKYGHKLVGGNTFPRSYYRCTSGNCKVRKQVERSKQDPSMVVTTYEGRHNHCAPGPILCLPQSL
ncbi:hypothetical protein CLOM_g5804 [Closterium sp. NIES-68]|nr:hypothetical protein CLOM_g5804 [Closterium sp. NIES-68]GJP73860.1 hypothetical protein CLOP_g4535 [Closterium sp. NIES-67]